MMEKIPEIQHTLKPNLISQALKLSLLSSLSLVLTACGGSSNDKQESPVTKNQAPIAANIILNGEAIVGGELSTTFSYSDNENDPSGSHIYQWFKDGQVITEQTSSKFIINEAAQGAEISVKITPMASQGELKGESVESSVKTVNFLPTANNIEISGRPAVGETLQAVYQFTDKENDKEGNTQFQWYRDNQVIDSATAVTYTLVEEDQGEKITVTIAPIAKSGSTVGNKTTSSALEAFSLTNPDSHNSAIAFTPKDEMLTIDQWYIDNQGIAPEQWGNYKNLKKGADLNIRPAWRQGITGKNIIVTVADDGLDFAHSELRNKELKDENGNTYSLDLVAGTNSAFPAHYSDDHGTGVAGVIAAQANNENLVGIAPDAMLIGLRALPGDHKKNTKNPDNALIDKPIAQVILESEAKSHVSNHSYGANDNGMLYTITQQDYKLYEALALKGGQDNTGHITVFAAGNGRANTLRKVDMSSVDDTLESGQFTEISLGDYAGYDITQQNPFVISVSCFSAQDHEVSYCEDGPGTLISGASGDSSALANEKSEKSATANITTTGAHNHNYRENINTDKGYDTHRSEQAPEPVGYNMAFNGTSAAAPTVSGIAALMKSANPKVTWRDVRWVLAKTARKIQGGYADEISGIYLDQTDNTAPKTNKLTYWSNAGNEQFGRYSHLFGYGAADAAAAVNYITNSAYTPLTAMQTCTIDAQAESVETVKVSFDGQSCPTTIEHVSLNYTISAGTFNNLAFSMNLSTPDGSTIDKPIRLLRETTCTANDGCDLTDSTAVNYAGTVGFMGDKLGEKSTLTFDVNQSARIQLNAVTIFGHN